MTPARAVLLGACFFLSGGTSLVLEVAWSKELSYILGNTLYAVSTVVAAFMAGLGAGSAAASRVAGRFERPLRAYAFLQFVVGAWGIASLPLFRATRPLFGALYQSLDPGQGLFLLARFGAVFLLMFVPAFLMGMTLPIVVGALARAKERYDLEAGVLYGVNTLGAVAGTLAAGFALIPALGLFRTCLLAGALDGVAGTLALLLDRRVGAIRDVRRDPARPGKPDGARAGKREEKRKRGAEEGAGAPGHAAPLPAAGWTPRQWLVAGIFGLSGLFAMVYEVGWFRLLGLAMGPSVYAFSAMLALFLAGVGIGSAVAAPRAQRGTGNGLLAMAVLEVALGFVTLASLFYLNALPTTNFRLAQWAVARFGEPGIALERLVLSGMVVFVPCLVMGMLFPYAVRAVREAGRRDAPPEATVGRLYLLNTAGGILGSLAAGFALVPGIGVWATLRIAGVASVLLGAALALLDGGTAPARRRALAGAALLVAVLFAWRAPAWDVRLFNQGIYREAYARMPFPENRLKEETLLFHREGINAGVAVIASPSGATLYISGKPDASYNQLDLMTQALCGHLPVMLATDPKRVAVVGYGSGMTPAAVLCHPGVERLDILEIEEGVIEASPYFEGINENPLDDPRTRLLLEDGRIHLTYSGDQYDVISSEPSNPWMAGVSNLFTTDYYRWARARLAPGGVFTQWIQAYDISEDLFQTILASVQEVFPHVMIFRSNPADCIVIASGGPIAIPWERFRARFDAPAVRTSFLRVGIREPLELAFFLHGPGPAMAAFAAGTTARSTDDNVWLEYRMPRALVRTAALPPGGGMAGRIAEMGANGRLQAALALWPGIPIEECVREIVAYPHRTEPVVFPDAIFSDPWEETRGILLAGTLAELRAMGRPELAERAAAWEGEANARRETRVRVTREVYEASIGAANPGAELLVRSREAAPDLPIVSIFIAADLENRGDLAGAEAFYREILDDPPSEMYYDAMLALARLASGRGDTESALGFLGLAARRNPFLPNAYVQAVRIHLQNGNPDEARRTLERGLRFQPRDPELVETARSLGMPG